MCTGLKAFSTWHMVRTIQECRECLGGAGFMAINRLASVRADADVFVTFEGDNTVVQQQVTKDVLADLLETYEENPLSTSIGALVDALVVLAQRKWARAPRFSAVNPIELPALRNALAFRQRVVLHLLARRLYGRTVRQGQDKFEAWTSCLQHVCDVAHGHVELLILDTFIATVEQQTTPGVQAVLQRFCHLYALQAVMKHVGWLLDAQVLRPGDEKALRQAFTQLCEQTMADAPTVVEAFAIPASCILSPLGGGPGEGTTQWPLQSML
jgi:acyl-CoA oxidase